MAIVLVCPCKKRETIVLVADLYQGTIEVDRYVTDSDCRDCGFFSREEFIEKLRKGEIGRKSCRLSLQRYNALRLAVEPYEFIPKVEVLQLPDPGPVGLFPINDPGHDAPVLVSGNSRLTIEVLTAVLSTIQSPFWYLVVNSDGNTVDMALIYHTFTPERISEALAGHVMSERVETRTLLIPGLAAFLQGQIASATGWSVSVGPVCAAELPLFLCSAWNMR